MEREGERKRGTDRQRTKGERVREPVQRKWRALLQGVTVVLSARVVYIAMWGVGETTASTVQIIDSNSDQGSEHIRRKCSYG